MELRVAIPAIISNAPAQECKKNNTTRREQPVARWLKQMRQRRRVSTDQTSSSVAHMTATRHLDASLNPLSQSHHTCVSCGQLWHLQITHCETPMSTFSWLQHFSQTSAVDMSVSADQTGIQMRTRGESTPHPHTFASWYMTRKNDQNACPNYHLFTRFFTLSSGQLQPSLWLAFVKKLFHTTLMYFAEHLVIYPIYLRSLLLDLHTNVNKWCDSHEPYRPRVYSLPGPPAPGRNGLALWVRPLVRSQAPDEEKVRKSECFERRPEVSQSFPINMKMNQYLLIPF